MPGPKPVDPVVRYWRFVDRGDPEQCWEWTGGRAGKGYGQFYRTKREPVGAHRFAYELAHGPIPQGLHICHRCDNPPCVNPAHLFAGTPADNMRDKSAKGRNPGNRKMTNRKQHALRGHDLDTALSMVARGDTQRAVARHFGVSPAAVCRALKVARHDARNADLALERVGPMLLDVDYGTAEVPS